MKVGFIGLGNMGFPMAGHLAAAGHEVTVYNRTAAKAESWTAAHAGPSQPQGADQGREPATKRMTSRALPAVVVTHCWLLSTSSRGSYRLDAPRTLGPPAGPGLSARYGWLGLSEAKPH